MRVLVDGVETAPEAAVISVFDWGLQRGFGCFEVVRSYEGVPFRLAQHLDRLGRGASVIGIKPPQRSDLEAWAAAVAESGGTCVVRIIVTAGGRDPLQDAPPRTVVMWEPLPDVPEPLRLLPMRAPWHPSTSESPFYAVKWLSYAPNMASTDRAREQGYDEALLINSAELVLEGPTFTVAWFADGRIETPELALGILTSITRSVLIESAARLGLAVVEGRFPLQRMIDADEAMALSTVKQVSRIGSIGEHTKEAGEVSAALAAAYADIVREETGVG
jgi:branched-subunit amino acid aminotransferase/4-amino-4-deoxychorismate lyase